MRNKPKAEMKQTRHSQITIGTIIKYVMLSFWAVTTIYPFIWILLNSFKPKGMILSHSFSIPVGEMFTWDNYITAFQRVNILGAYANSVVISISVTFFVVFIAGFAAYGMSRYAFRGRRVLQPAIIASMMFPIFATIIPVFRMQFSWGIVNTDSLPLTWLSVILPQVAGNLAFAIIVLMGYISSVPLVLEEAAFIEGCSVYQIFIRIILPIAKPSFASVAIFTFLWSYNDLFTQMFFLRYKKTFTITRLLNEISSKSGVNYGLMAAAVVLVVVPVLIFYVILQKQIISGLTAGAVKG
ncbi:MAG: carbohydrate ABC transporter permease [Anaerocolumna sp.]